VPASTPTFTETPSSIIAEEGRQKVTEVLVYPVPFNPGKYPYGILLQFNLTKSSSEVTLKIYSSSFRLVRNVRLAGTFAAGENRGFAEAEQFNNLANGTYYYRLIAESPSGAGYSTAGKIIIIK